MTVKTSNTHSIHLLLNKFEPKDQLSNTILFYEGEVNHEITKALTLTTERHLAENSEKRIVQKKVFNVMIECLQNIDKHTIEQSAIETNLTKKGAILITELIDSYCIISGNPVTQKQMNVLTEIISNLKHKKKEDLRSLYKIQLENGRLSDKGGAGLGFIDMARKTGNTLSFSFIDLENKLYLFVLKITINKNI